MLWFLSKKIKVGDVIRTEDGYVGTVEEINEDVYKVVKRGLFKNEARFLLREEMKLVTKVEGK